MSCANILTIRISVAFSFNFLMKTAGYYFRKVNSLLTSNVYLLLTVGHVKCIFRLRSKRPIVKIFQYFGFVTFCVT